MSQAMRASPPLRRTMSFLTEAQHVEPLAKDPALRERGQHDCKIWRRDTTRGGSQFVLPSFGHAHGVAKGGTARVRRHHIMQARIELCRSAAFQYLSPVFSLVTLAQNYIDASFGRWPEETAKKDLLRRSSPEHFVPGAHLEAGGGRPVPSLGPSRPSFIGSFGSGIGQKCSSSLLTTSQARHKGHHFSHFNFGSSQHR